jgi:hypothetical protein
MVRDKTRRAVNMIRLTEQRRRSLFLYFAAIADKVRDFLSKRQCGEQRSAGFRSSKPA